MMTSPRRRRMLQGLAAALVATALPAMAEPAYPQKPIQLLVPFTPGGLTDNLGRLVGQRLSAALGQPIVVENRPGGGTLLAAGMLAKAPADGYTLMVATSTTLGIAPVLYKGSTFKIEDVTGVAMLGNVTLLLATRPDFPAKDVHELVARLREKPGAYNFASPGSGTAHHLLVELLMTQEQVSAAHIPYKGSGQPLTELMAGRVDFMFIDQSIALSHAQAGKIKVLAVTGTGRSPFLPNVPTITETYPKLDLQIRQAIVAPAGTPAPIVNRLNAEINKILAAPDVREKLMQYGLDPKPMSVAEFNDVIRKDAVRWAEIVKRSGAKAD